MKYLLDDVEIALSIIIKRKNKRSYIRIKAPNIVELISPFKMSDDDIIEILESHKKYIKEKILNRRVQIEKPRENIHYLGKEYKLNIIIDKIEFVRLNGDIMEVHVKDSSLNRAKRVIYLFYIETLKNIVNDNIDRIKREMKIDFPISFSYRDVKSYYGKCYFKERVVILQIALCKYEMKYILSVIYHELAHFYYQDHQAGFYSLLEEVFPGYKRIQHELRQTKYLDIC